MTVIKILYEAKIRREKIEWTKILGMKSHEFDGVSSISDGWKITFIGHWDMKRARPVMRRLNRAGFKTVKIYQKLHSIAGRGEVDRTIFEITRK